MEGLMQNRKQLHNSFGLWYDFSKTVLNVVYGFHFKIDKN